MSGGEVIAIIPARGGSRGVPRKNVRPVGGVPLIVRAVSSARAAHGIDRVVVTTDDDEIAALSRAHGAEVIARPAELAGDTASSESALDHALEVLGAAGVDASVVVFIQATSPFIDPDDLDDAVARVRSRAADVVFSAVPSWGFLWRQAPDGVGVSGVNHDPAHRPRRQDREPEYLETGAFYVLDGDGYRAARHRFFGAVAAGIVAEHAAIEIDTEEQLRHADALAALVDPIAPIDVDAVVTDFDGVHTDDRVLVSEDGTEYVTVNRSDGMGVAALTRAGVPLLILSTERNRVVAARARKLGVEVRHGLDDKAAALVEWAKDAGIPLERIAYLGNDVNDLACLDLVGWPVATPGAHPLVLAAARTVLGRAGGDGAVRELADRVLASLEPPTRVPAASRPAPPREDTRA
ncbi:acylneuraminate cytidylyltransferase [Protaetiibacter larvae]|uniref:N-acylneuraminate cytidylyltransferase n=1 Tax=Protaetiibacter larvae TaxID=2592654 RepID=A0A5C1Y8R4_9MICO|nr:acylneuraminate cytidylyltransferase [Protaetiibacter larvae]QEO10483.1 acylneuraminate cytidylyltransferase [Protaetiibacter larvae]